MPPTQADPKLPIGTRKCKCQTCNIYFTSISAFDSHIKGRHHHNPATLKSKSGELVLKERDGYWGSAKDYEYQEA